jgi:hypothetical protein
MRWLWVSFADSFSKEARRAKSIGLDRAFVRRADLKGDLGASALASLAHDAGAGRSEMSLARAAGGRGRRCGMRS